MPPVLLVRGDASSKAGAAAAQMADAAFASAVRALRAARVPFRATSDTRIEAVGFGAQRVAIFPYSRVFSQREAQRLGAWLAAGGRAIFVHALPSAAAKVLGFPPAEPVAAAGEPFRAIEFAPSAVLGLPRHVTVQVQWAHRLPAAKDVTALGLVRGGPGQLPLPAVYLSPTGAYVVCSLHASPPPEAGALLRALAGHFYPRLWDILVPPTPAQVGPVASWPNLDAFISALRRRQAEGPHIRRALNLAKEALASVVHARELLGRGLADAAVDCAAGALAAARRAFWMAWPSRPDELRGVWACNYAEPSWDAAAAALADANITVVFPYVASSAAAFYRSSVLPAADGRGEHDWLAECVRACHAHGIKVHARILGLSCLFATAEVREQYERAGWLMLDTEGDTWRWVCPSNPANRKRLIAAAVEIASKYGVDGIQLDYIRYPGSRVCACQHCRRAFEQWLGRKVTGWPKDTILGGGRKAFLEFRRRQLTGLVGELRSALHKARPGLPLSAAVFVNWQKHRDAFGQDWANWLRDGLIDFACPMDYTARLDRYQQWVENQRRWAGDRPLCFGIGPFADGVGDFSPLTVARQIQIARSAGQGWVIFNLNPRLLSGYLPYLSLGITYRQAALPSWAACPSAR